MDEQLEALEKRIKSRNYDSPPLHLWNPPLSGAMDIQICSDGRWLHEGSPIERESIVRLFASILRKEEDGGFYLVTPGEKWRIQVDLHPLLVIDVKEREEGGSNSLIAVLNSGKEIPISEQYPLFLEPALGDVACVALDHGLSALFSRAAWLRLVDMVEERNGVPYIISGQYAFALDGSA